jgi:hypothetical protein
MIMSRSSRGRDRIVGFPDAAGLEIIIDASRDVCQRIIATSEEPAHHVMLLGPPALSGWRCNCIAT